MKKFIEKIKNILRSNESLEDTAPLEPIEDVENSDVVREESENNRYIWLSVALVLIAIVSILIAMCMGGSNAASVDIPKEAVESVTETVETQDVVQKIEAVRDLVEVEDEVENSETDNVDISVETEDKNDKTETKPETDNKPSVDNDNNNVVEPSEPEKENSKEEESDNVAEPEVKPEPEEPDEEEGEGEESEPKEEESEEPELNLGAADSELEMLAIVIYREAGSDSHCDECRRRVADVVLNRVADPRYPNTIYGVLTQRSQYGNMHWTGVVWPDRAYSQYEADAVRRAYRIAEEVLNGQHSSLYGEGYIYQAEFKQGTDIIYHCGHYFGK